MGHPLDTIKVNLQTQDPRNPAYRGTWHCLRTIVAKESVRGLYKGIASPVAGVAFVNSIVFGVYGNVQRHHSQPESLNAHFIAGSVAGCAQSVISSPMELVKTRLQLQHQLGEKYRGSVDCLKKVWLRGGFNGVFQGFGITALRDVPGFASYFVSYEMMVKKDSSAAHILIAGGLAGVISWVFTYPLDVLKTKMQMDLSGKYSGVLDCVVKTWKNDGPATFTRGISSTLIRAFPTNAVCFFVVSSILRLSDKFSQEKGIEQPVVVKAKPRPIIRIKYDDDLDYISRIKSNTIRGLTLMGAFHEDSVQRAEIYELTNNFQETEQEMYLDFETVISRRAEGNSNTLISD